MRLQILDSPCPVQHASCRDLVVFAIAYCNHTPGFMQDRSDSARGDGMSRQMNIQSLCMVDRYRVDLKQYYNGDDWRGVAQRCNVVDQRTTSTYLSATTSLFLGPHIQGTVHLGRLHTTSSRVLSTKGNITSTRANESLITHPLAKSH